MFLDSGFRNYKKVEIEEKDGELKKISRSNDEGQSITYIPDISAVKVSDIPKGHLYSPTKSK